MSSNLASTLEFPSEPLLSRGCPPQPPSYVLTATTDGSPSGMSYIVTSIVECITEREKGLRRVFRVKVRSETFQEPRQLICKVAFGRQWFRSLEAEALLYEQKLKPLWGKVVPHYYGFFRGDTYEGKTGILLMEDCGQPASDELSRQPLYFRKLLLEAFVALHRAGVSFQDSGLCFEDNVVIHYDPASDKHVPKLIDFSVVYPDHQCLYNHSEIVEGAPEPSLSEISCHLLWWTFCSSAVFIPRCVMVRGTPVPWEYATDAETLKAHCTFPEFVTEDAIERQIAAALEERARWEQEREECDYGPVRVKRERELDVSESR
ncbi:hypothetical protein PYCCODRAFT_1466657 [Trametes coccinea BRFM310]|uniref:Protein kinase domain-containing protein n=1 Tax=Trametes coccinea (strain BRFM310) TaxID=1353009 RepID=A0A1Y2IRI3_TRAC3|nr:hypothetical protein PYCCODRAFT_1466657 [Trametes coccinea BRFM310]